MYLVDELVYLCMHHSSVHPHPFIHLIDASSSRFSVFDQTTFSSFFFFSFSNLLPLFAFELEFEFDYPIAGTHRGIVHPVIFMILCEKLQEIDKSSNTKTYVAV